MENLTGWNEWARKMFPFPPWPVNCCFSLLLGFLPRLCFKYYAQICTVEEKKRWNSCYSLTLNSTGQIYYFRDPLQLHWRASFWRFKTAYNTTMSTYVIRHWWQVFTEKRKEQKAPWLCHSYRIDYKLQQRWVLASDLPVLLLSEFLSENIDLLPPAISSETSCV